MSHLNIIVVGGGYAGREFLVRMFHKHIKGFPRRMNVFLIDERDYFENNAISPRFLVNPDLFDKMAAPLKKMFPVVKFIHGKVESVLPGNAIRVKARILIRNAQGEFWEMREYHYDYLILCTGSKYHVFKGDNEYLSQRRAEVIQYSLKIRNAQQILIIGGGSVGVEFAAEILETYPDKKITIVHKGDSLVVGRYSQKWLKKRGVTIILKDRVILDDSIHDRESSGIMREYQTTGGEVIHADLVFNCGGLKYTANLFQEHFPLSQFEDGSIKVLPTLQVAGFRNVLAFGDAVKIKGVARTAANVHKQSKVVVKNLQSLIQNGDHMRRYTRGMKSEAIVTLGKSYGVESVVSFFGISPHGKKWSKIKESVLAKSAPSIPEIAP
eukprot:TRINITY_DN3961_c0_g1_i1.p1 TRINITY_DN3961_c0_g1~~TRINITY_DN3961_c0_g1_i1.p1  ORF type:complete len:382 (-),score=73.31 TRINITY_DN3961_c0_g1_i1:184-1329(-)